MFLCCPRLEQKLPGGGDITLFDTQETASAPRNYWVSITHEGQAGAPFSPRFALHTQPLMYVYPALYPRLHAPTTSRRTTSVLGFCPHGDILIAVAPEFL